MSAELSQIPNQTLLTKSFTIDKAMSNDFQFIISQEVVDRGGDRVMIDGIDISNYKANPVIFYNHDSYSLPIAKATNLQVKSINGIKSLVATVEFDENDETARLVKSKVANGFLNATSIGIIAKEVTQVKASEQEFLKYLRSYINQINRSELLEFSIVTIPMNQNALSVKGFSKAENEILTKAGKVLSNANFNKLTQAYNSIGEVLTNANSQDEKAIPLLTNKETPNMEKEIQKLDNSELETINKGVETLENKVNELSNEMATKNAIIEDLQKSIRSNVAPLIEVKELTAEQKFNNNLMLIAKGLKAGSFEKAGILNPDLKKDFDSAINAQGGFLISQDYAPEILPYLYPNSILNVAPVSRVSMSRRSLKMPIIGAIDDLGFTNKNGTGAEVDATFSELELSTRYLRSMMVIHNELLEDSDYAVQQFLANQLTQKASVTLDNKALYGTGASDELLGLSSQVNSSNKFNSAGTSLANFIADSVKAVRLVSQSIQLMNRATCGWVMSDTQYYGILGLATSTGAEPSLVAELKQGRLHGFPVFTSNTVTSTEIWFGDWSKVYLGIYKEASVTFELNGTFQIGSTTYVGRDIRKSPLRLEAELDIKLAYPKALSIIQASSLGA